MYAVINLKGTDKGLTAEMEALMKKALPTHMVKRLVWFQLRNLTFGNANKAAVPNTQTPRCQVSTPTFLTMRGAQNN